MTAAPRPNVLLIERTGATRTLIERTLLENGFRVTAVESLVTAVQGAGRTPANVVVMATPDTDRREHRQLAREAVAIWDAGVVIISGAITSSPRPMQCDAFVLLPKPFTPSELLDAMTLAMQRSEREPSA
jgi:DNA-binding response OmpR family regulator